jgi:hypothetical protein
MTTVQFVVATGLSLLVFVALANFVVDFYARGVVRSAVDEGARAGAPIDLGTGDCAARAHAVVSNLLGGPLGNDVQVSCRERRGSITAVADVTLRSWLPGVVPDWSFRIVGSATKEREP